MNRSDMGLQMWRVEFLFPGRGAVRGVRIKAMRRSYQLVAFSRDEALLVACGLVRAQLHHDKHRRSIRLWTVPTVVYASPIGREFFAYEERLTKAQYQAELEHSEGNELTGELRKLWEDFHV